MKERLLKQARHEYSPRQRLVLMLFLAPVFLALLPYLVFILGARVDRWLGWGPILPPPWHWILGVLLIGAGWALAMWAIYTQITIGRGTPVPLMATQKLIVQPPFTYCRNPMALGTLGLYLGVALLFRSGGSVLVVLAGMTLLLLYIRLLEEKEMEARFGQAYLDYRRSTPFFIPRFGRRG